jgi:hypothetical protein
VIAASIIRGLSADVSDVLVVSIIRAMSPLVMKAARASETSINFYQTTRRNNPEDSHLHTRRENPKYHTANILIHYVHTFKISELFRLSGGDVSYS